MDYHDIFFNGHSTIIESFLFSPPQTPTHSVYCSTAPEDQPTARADDSTMALALASNMNLGIRSC